VLNDGCGLGYPGMVGAFLGGGCRAYIGSAKGTRGDATLLFTLHFYYELLTKGCTEREAVRLAASTDEQTALFRFYDRDSIEEEKP
jgi:hypothetical protein